MKAIQNYQKIYTDLNCQEVKFEIGNYVFLKISLMRRVTHFDIKGKLVSRYFEPFEIIERVANFATLARPLAQCPLCFC